MINNDCSRRDFLKKFALLSAGTLVLTAPTLACYGPPPEGGLQYPLVSGIYFLDSQGRNSLLKNNQNVPVNTEFTIYFTDNMNTSAPAGVSLTDTLNNSVPCGQNWDTVRLVRLKPATVLSPNMGYTLRVEDAEDARGYTIQLSESSTATFKTAEA